MHTWIKICGTALMEDALASVEAGADALGFIFAPSRRQISPAGASEIVARLPERVEKVGVFVNEAPDRIGAIAEQVGLTAVQLHGDETPAAMASLRAATSLQKIKIIKTVVVRPGFEARLAELRHHATVDFILLDSGAGSGQTFDWQSATAWFSERNRQNSSPRLVIAGGLNPENVAEAVRQFSPWGVDVVSGVEREPGRKDPEKLQAFIKAVRAVSQVTQS